MIKTSQMGLINLSYFCMDFFLLFILIILHFFCHNLPNLISFLTLIKNFNINNKHSPLNKMQFQLLLNRALNRNKQYNKLLTQLTQKQQNCLKTSKSISETQKCRQKATQFQLYIQSYRMQFKKKGRKMCDEMMKQQNDLDNKIIVKDQCFKFYSRSIVIFEENAIDKLRSLVKNIDFSQL